MKDLAEAVQAIVAFRDERAWGQFHTPRNLAAALAIEASELQEVILWKTDAEVLKLLEAPEGRRSVEREIADVLIFALLLCHETQIDPLKAVQAKLIENATRYPVELAKGNATKYDRLGRQ